MQHTRPSPLFSLASFLCYLVISVLGATASGSSPPEESAIEVIYGYQYPDSFMTQAIQEYLWNHFQLNVQIKYIHSIQNRNRPWITDRELFLTDRASGLCSVHALSLPSPSSATLNSYGGAQAFRVVSPDDLSQYAPLYYRAVIKAHDDERIAPAGRSAPIYSLPGYNFLNDQSVFHLAATPSAASHLGLTLDSGHKLPQIRSLSTLRLFHVGKIELAHLNSALNELAHSDPQPFLAWQYFEHSFAPIYSSLGISTVGTNLTRTHSLNIPYFIDGTQLLAAQISPAFKNSLELISRWYDQGIINNDFPTLSRDGFRRVVEQGLRDDHPLFFAIPYSSALISPSAYVEDPYSEARIAILQVVNNNRAERSLSHSPFLEAEAYSSCVPDEAVQPLLRIFEYTRWPDSIGWTQRVFGMENIHYYYLPNDLIAPYRVASVADSLPGSRNADDFAMWHFKAAPQITLDWRHARNLYLPGESIRLAESTNYNLDTLLHGNPYRKPLALDSPVPTDLDHNALSEIFQTYVIDSIIGDASEINNTWDAYVARWMAAGGNAIITALQEMYRLS